MIQLKLNGSKKTDLPVYHPMCPEQTPVSDKHSQQPACQPAACLGRMINTVYACSTSGSVDINACWTSMTPPIQTSGASQTQR